MRPRTIPIMSATPHIETEITEGPVPEPTLGAGDGGGICGFVGVTRPEAHPTHGPLLALDYEAARPLADHLLRTIADEIARRHGLRRLTIRHAIGRVPVGDAAVAIVAVADHRDAAFAGCREAIDRTKSEVPIWKRERWRDGDSWSSRATAIEPPAAGARLCESAVPPIEAPR